MGIHLNEETLQSENARHAGTGGRSQENRQCGFRPAFLDALTNVIYPCRFADGRPAPIHVLDGLPDEVVERRSETGRILAARGSLVSGFVLGNRFFTREDAAAFTRA
ncbi:hypothetical protein BWI17_18800 [Betaproteobacteria bacterium GR16-43]|nr:hypothetical protein BWI17_18800 [Betaproteobacteria bacterium GR16-43]